MLECERVTTMTIHQVYYYVQMPYHFIGDGDSPRIPFYLSVKDIYDFIGNLKQ